MRVYPAESPPPSPSSSVEPGARCSAAEAQGARLGLRILCTLHPAAALDSRACVAAQAALSVFLSPQHRQDWRSTRVRWPSCIADASGSLYPSVVARLAIHGCRAPFGPTHHARAVLLDTECVPKLEEVQAVLHGRRREYDLLGGGPPSSPLPPPATDPRTPLAFPLFPAQ